MYIRKVRNSNIELMRIIVMLFIISHHFMLYGMHVWDDNSWGNFTLLSLDSAFYIAVNVFLLISGYCGIRFEWRKILRLYLLTAIIGGFCYLVHFFIGDASLDKEALYNIIFSISHTNAWFIKIYVYLLLISPIINAALNSFNKNQLQMILLILTLICVYFGWIWKDSINPYGYSLINFVWVYTIGHYIARYFDSCRFIPVIYLLLWILASLLNVVLSITLERYAAWTYHNPLVVLASIAFFLFFISLNFSSKTINVIAQSTLGVYLIHENGYIARFLYSTPCVSFFSSNLLQFILSVLSLYVICIVADFSIRYILVNPLFKVISSFIDRDNVFSIKKMS